jgi:hypothetical protein
MLLSHKLYHTENQYGIDVRPMYQKIALIAKSLHEKFPGFIGIFPK